MFSYFICHSIQYHLWQGREYCSEQLNIHDKINKWTEVWLHLLYMITKWGQLFLGLRPILFTSEFPFLSVHLSLTSVTNICHKCLSKQACCLSSTRAQVCDIWLVWLRCLRDTKTPCAKMSVCHLYTQTVGSWGSFPNTRRHPITKPLAQWDTWVITHSSFPQTTLHETTAESGPCFLLKESSHECGTLDAGVHCLYHGQHPLELVISNIS
jgi:hypothetical protein